MENKLTTQLWSIAKEIARQFGEVIEMEPEFWVNDDPTDICAFGDTYFFTLTEMKQVIDNLPRYIKQYGTLQAVGEEIRAWVDWWLKDVTSDQLDIEYTSHTPCGQTSTLKLGSMAAHAPSATPTMAKLAPTTHCAASTPC